MRVILVAIVVVAGACGADDAMGDGDGDGDVDGGVGCDTLPNVSPTWLRGYQTEVVERLAGAREIAPGVTLSDRSQPSSRAQARDYIAAELTALGLRAQLHSYGAGTNPFAFVEANRAAQGTLLLGAHFDSVPGSPGANDNATGVAMVLAAARYLGELECRDHDVIVAFFDEEEIGLVGSAAFAANLDANNTPLVAAHTIDQMGWDQNGDRLIEVELPAPGLLSFYQSAATAEGLAIPLVETSTGSTDHSSFRQRGYSAVGLTEGFVSGDTTPHYHASTDTAATVDFEYLASSTALLHAAFGGLVLAPE